VSQVTASSQTIAHDSADIKPSGEGATAIVDSVLNGTAAAGDADFRAGKLLAGYIVERQIGKGGMGVVYLATDGFASSFWFKSITNSPWPTRTCRRRTISNTSPASGSASTSEARPIATRR
jgi:hypothetical protein